MKDTAVREAAERLLLAYERREPVAPLIETYPEATLVDAYRVQLEQVRTWVGRGEVVKGHKVGLASKAMQRQLGVGQPDYGHLLFGMFHLEHQPIPAGSSCSLGSSRRSRSCSARAWGARV